MIDTNGKSEISIDKRRQLGDLRNIDQTKLIEILRKMRLRDSPVGRSTNAIISDDRIYPMRAGLKYLDVLVA